MIVAWCRVWCCLKALEGRCVLLCPSSGRLCLILIEGSGGNVLKIAAICEDEFDNSKGMFDDCSGVCGV